MYHNHRSLIRRLKDAGRLKGKASRAPTVVQDVDGCFGQYFSVRAARLQAKLSKVERVTIFKRRCCPGHGKKKSDGAHAVIKRFGRERMAMKDDGDETKPLMEASVVVEGVRTDLASELHRVCSAEKEEGVKGGMNVKRQRLGKMERREFYLYKEEDVEHRDLCDYKTLDPSTPDERRRTLPHSGVKAYHNMLTEPALPEDEVLLRRWPCRCPACKAELAKPVARRRMHVPECTLQPMAQGLNDWRQLKMVPKEEGDGDGDESDGDDEALIEMVNQLADAVIAGDYGAIDAGGDSKAAGSDEDGRYNLVRFTSEAYELTRAKDSDWGKLPRGTRVIDATWLNVVYTSDPNHTPRWYTPNPLKVVVPVEQVLHVSFEMEAAQLPPRGASTIQRSAVAKGAVVLSEDDHGVIMDELRQR